MKRRTFVFRALFIIALIVCLKAAYEHFSRYLYVSSIERTERIQDYPKRIYLEVNIPEGALYVFQFYNDDQYLLKKYPCSVGTIEFKTPEGDFLTSEVVWNPGWVPPSSNWAKDREEAKPGKGSPLGGGALVVDWDEELLIHGAGQEAELGKPSSHGCIRLSDNDMTELLSFIQNSVPNSVGTANVPLYKEHPHKSVRVNLYRPVAVNLVYRRAETMGRHVVLYPDVYTYGTKVPSLNADVTSALSKNKHIDQVILDFSLKPVPPSASVQQIREDRKGTSKKAALKRYYSSLKLNFFVWYINTKGDVSAWSQLLSKP